jgi:hypothetical protein
MTERAPQLRFFQLRDAAGTDSLREWTVEAPSRFLESPAVSLVRVIRQYNPKLTDHMGVYWYLQPGVGSGWMRAEGASPRDIATLHELVLVDDLAAATATTEGSWRIDPPVPGFGQPRTGNPYVLIVWGAIVVVLGVISTFAVTFGAQFAATPLPGRISAGAISLVLVPLGIVLVVIGTRRMRWWRATRAEAKRRGITDLPDKISGMGV